MISKLPQEKKGKRLPDRRCMTLVAGFQCHEGIVLLADMEESAGFTAKRKIGKLQPIEYFGEWMAIVGGAGDSAVIDNATEELTRKWSLIRPFDLGRFTTAIDSTLRMSTRSTSIRTRNQKE